MESFITHSGVVVPLNRININTDDIIPARFLKTINRTGFADALFANWRYLEDGHSPNPDFSLNQTRYQDASILLSGANFGCGSSREHAPWAIREFGIRCIIAPSFADIFYNNCFNNGILLITLEENIVQKLLQEIERHDGYILYVNLAQQFLCTPEQEAICFQVDPFRQKALLKGLDNIEWILSHTDEIAAYEQRKHQEIPWLVD